MDLAMPKWSIERKTLAGFTGAALMLLLIIGGVYFTMQSFIGSSRRAHQLMEVLSAQERVYSAVVEAVINQRTFVVTRQDEYLQQRDAAVARVRMRMNALRSLTQGSTPEEVALVRDLDRAVNRQVEMIDRFLQARVTGRANSGGSGMAELQAEFGRIRGMLDRLENLRIEQLNEQLATDRQAVQLLYALLALTAVIFVCLLTMLSRRIIADLRERKEVEQRLQDANQFLESLLEHIPAMVFAKNASDLRFVRFNRAGEELLGYTREAMLGKNNFDLHPASLAEQLTHKDREVLAQRGMVDIAEEEVETLEQGRRVLHTRKVPIRDHQGLPIYLLGISMDITEQKATERRINALNAQLQDHSEMLESSNRELESFCYSVSHDLRAPLRAINGFARLLEQEYSPRLDNDAARYIQTICKASERMGRLIDDLLEFSRVGRQTIARERVDMTLLARRVVNDVLLARDRPLPTITVEELPTATGDRRLLHLVWLNLLDNAVKYTERTQNAAITVSAREEMDEVVYSVRDNGIGFDMQYYDKLFGVFQRLHSNPDYPGTGVGLAIAHRVVAGHGGRIWAQGEPGRGATFSFALPVERERTVEHPLLEVQAAG